MTIVFHFYNLTPGAFKSLSRSNWLYKEIIGLPCNLIKMTTGLFLLLGIEEVLFWELREFVTTFGTESEGQFVSAGHEFFSPSFSPILDWFFGRNNGFWVELKKKGPPTDALLQSVYSVCQKISSSTLSDINKFPQSGTTNAQIGHLKRH